MTSKRGKIVDPARQACAHCPWRRSNWGKRTSGGWYTKANLRRLWGELRTGEARGMTCHPTDPDNPPSDDGRQAPEGADTQECYGSLLLIARELYVIQELDKAGAGDRVFPEYKRRWPKRGLTLQGAFYWAARGSYPTNPITGRQLPREYVEDDDIAHPDFDTPKLGEKIT